MFLLTQAANKDGADADPSVSLYCSPYKVGGKLVERVQELEAKLLKFGPLPPGAGDDQIPCVDISADDDWGPAGDMLSIMACGYLDLS